MRRANLATQECRRRELIHEQGHTPQPTATLRLREADGDPAFTGHVSAPTATVVLAAIMTTC